MEPTNSYLTSAQTYADRVRVLFAPAGAPTGERGGAGPVSHEELAAQATRLSADSAKLTTEAEAKLAADKDPIVRAHTASQLLAKAAIDLEVGAYLLKAAQEEEAKISWSHSGAVVRSAGSRKDVEEYLEILIQQGPDTSPPGLTRSASAVD